MVSNGPRTFDRACVVVISDQEILSFGGHYNGYGSQRRVWKYNVHTSQWTRMPDLIYKRLESSCQLFKDGPLSTNHYVLIAGGAGGGID